MNQGLWFMWAYVRPSGHSHAVFLDTAELYYCGAI